MTPENARIVAALPRAQGVYVLRDHGARPLYVGASVDVRARVASHLGERKDRFPGQEAMARATRSVRWIPTDSRLETLLLEARLIRRWRPPHNRSIRNYPRYAYLRIPPDERFPRVRVTTEDREIADPLYGPWRKEHRAGRVAWALRKAFGLRPCRLALRQRTFFTVCDRKGAAACAAPCDASHPAEDYARRVSAARAFLEGREPGAALDVEDEEARETLDQAFGMLARLREAVEAPDEILRLPAATGRKVLLVRAGRPHGPFPVPTDERGLARLLARLRRIPRPDPARALPKRVVDDVKILAAHQDAVPPRDRFPADVSPSALVG